MRHTKIEKRLVCDGAKPNEVGSDLTEFR